MLFGNYHCNINIVRGNLVLLTLDQNGPLYYLLVYVGGGFTWFGIYANVRCKQFKVKNNWISTKYLKLELYWIKVIDGQI